MSTFVGPDGEVDEEYFERTQKHYVQWIDDTGNRSYDRVWLNYQQYDRAWLNDQHEIALRHHRPKKNETDGADSTDIVPMRYLVTLIHPMSNVRFVLEGGDFDDREFEQINDAWGKSLAM